MTDKSEAAIFAAAFSPIAQPDSITCGPTCLVTLVRALTILQNGSKVHFPGPNALRSEIKEIGRRMGTCNEFGTRHVEMEVGLRLFGLPVIRSVGGMAPDNDTGEPAGMIRLDAWDVLERTIRDGNAILLRTLWRGWKHWVLLCGNTDGSLFLVDPAPGCISRIENDQGIKRLKSEIVNAWSLRGYDGFTVPLSAVPRPLSEVLS